MELMEPGIPCSPLVSRQGEDRAYIAFAPVAVLKNLGSGAVPGSEFAGLFKISVITKTLFVLHIANISCSWAN